MEFLKKNYEKVLLGVVLLGLTVAVAMLPIVLSSKRAELKAIADNLSHPKVKELPPLDISTQQAVLQRAQTRVRFNFTRDHNTFNPVLWQKTADGRIIKVKTGREVGPEAVEVTDIKPLYLRLSFDSPTANGFFIGVEQEAAARLDKRSKHQTLANKGQKNDIFTLTDAKTNADN